MAPLTQGESVSTYVARSLDIIDKSGLPYQLTPMGTILEGEWDEVMAVATACFEAMRAGCACRDCQERAEARRIFSSVTGTGDDHERIERDS